MLVAELRENRMRGTRVSPSRFREMVSEALDVLPPDWLERLDNVAITVEEEPGPDDLLVLGDPEDGGGDLLGLYHGVPVGDRGDFLSPLPDRIVLFRGPILRAARSRHEVTQIIRETILHEIGHHFGLDEDDLPF